MKRQLLDNLIKQLLKIGNENLMRDFLEGILTLKELEEIPLRLEIIRLLKKGISQREIANQLGVGVATVTRGSSELKKGRFLAVK